MQDLMQELIRRRAIAASGNLVRQPEQSCSVLHSQLQKLAMPELDEIRGVVRWQMWIGIVSDEQVLSVRASFDEPIPGDRGLIGEFQFVAFVCELGESFSEFGLQLGVLPFLCIAGPTGGSENQNRCEGESLAKLRV